MREITDVEKDIITTIIVTFMLAYAPRQVWFSAAHEAIKGLRRKD